MSDVVSNLTSAFTLAFVVTSMFGLGLGLTLREVLEPLRNVRLVLFSLAANFVILPLVAYLLTSLLPLDPDMQVGVILMSAVAGAPLALKASQLGRGNLQFSASLVTLQVIVTVIFVPFALPLLLPGIEVDTVALAMPLILQILLPLAVGMLMNARYDEESEATRPIMTEISNLSLAAIVLIIVGLGSGYLLGGPEVKTRRTLALGTGHRNYAAAFVIAGGSFADEPRVIVYLLAASLVSIGIVMLTAGEFRKRASRAGDEGSEVAEGAEASAGA